MAVGHEIDKGGKRPRKRATQTRNGATAAQNGAVGDAQIPESDLAELLAGLNAARDGNFHLRLPAAGTGVVADLHRAFNELAERRESFSKEVARVGRAIGREGRLNERAQAPD